MKLLIPTLPIFTLILASCAGNKIPTSELDTVGVPATRATLADHATGEALGILPEKWDLANVFDAYNTLHDKRIGAAWARNWTSDVDLTGVAWDAKESGTLVSPRHILMAGHASREKGEKLAFHDKDGNIHVRTVVAVQRLTDTWRQDVAVGLLDEDVPVKHYKILPPEAGYKDLEGALVFPTNHRLSLLAARVHKVKDAGVYLSHDPELPRHWQQQLIAGDSGNPTFILVDGEPVLLSTHSLGGAGAGPFLSHPVNYNAINRAMKSMGGSSHQLQTVALEGAVPYVPEAPKAKWNSSLLRASAPARKPHSHAGHDHSGHNHSGHSHSGHSHAKPSATTVKAPAETSSATGHSGHDHAAHDHTGRKHIVAPAPAPVAAADAHDHAAVPMPTVAESQPLSPSSPSLSESQPNITVDPSSGIIPPGE